MTIIANDVFIEPVYRRAENDDGSYDAHVGYQLLARVSNEHGGSTYYRHEFVGLNDAVESLEARVRAAGLTINLDHWEFASEDNRTVEDLEYEWEQVAYRERLGLPL